jgi:hypothetical protein
MLDMKMVQLKYGKEKMVLEIPDQNLIGILEANPLDTAGSGNGRTG